MENSCLPFNYQLRRTILLVQFMIWIDWMDTQCHDKTGMENIEHNMNDRKRYWSLWNCTMFVRFSRYNSMKSMMDYISGEPSTVKQAELYNERSLLFTKKFEQQNTRTHRIIATFSEWMLPTARSSLCVRF